MASVAGFSEIGVQVKEGFKGSGWILTAIINQARYLQRDLTIIESDEKTEKGFAESEQGIFHGLAVQKSDLAGEREAGWRVLRLLNQRSSNVDAIFYREGHDPARLAVAVHLLFVGCCS